MSREVLDAVRRKSEQEKRVKAILAAFEAILQRQPEEKRVDVEEKSKIVIDTQINEQSENKI